MRYTGSVSNAFVQSMAHNFEQALRLMEAALTDCPDEPVADGLVAGRGAYGSGAARGIARLGALVPRLPRAEYARL